MKTVEARVRYKVREKSGRYSYATAEIVVHVPDDATPEQQREAIWDSAKIVQPDGSEMFVTYNILVHAPEQSAK